MGGIPDTRRLNEAASSWIYGYSITGSGAVRSRVRKD